MMQMLSDDAKLRERIIDVARNERNGLLIVIIGVFLSGSGLIFSIAGGNEFAYFGGILVSALGIFSTVFGFYVTYYYTRQYNDLLQELEYTI